MTTCPAGYFARLSLRTCSLLIAALALVDHVSAADAYFRVPVTELEILEGELPTTPDKVAGYRDPRLVALMRPYVMLENGGEGYVRGPALVLDSTSRWSLWEILAKSADGMELVGRLYLTDLQGKAVPPIRFRLPASKANVNHRVEFLRTRLDHYDYLATRPIPGAAWFRHQAMASATELSIAVPNSLRPAVRNNGAASVGFERTLDLFTGQRAISENLALDRLAEGTSVGRPTVGVDALRGITVAEIDWKPLLLADSPELDRLASVIPADQHAVFLPSFSALTRLVDRYQQFDATILQTVLPPRQEYDILRRYQQQMGVSLSAGARILGAALVKSVAITGGDPYFVTGTDVAIVFETDQPAVLRDALLASVRASLTPLPGVSAREGTAGGVSYSGFASPDRLASGYVAALPNAVILTNSIGQVARLGAVQLDAQKSLAKLDEFHYFRQRYRLGAADETAFVFLSDATIRRWCGPRWRIGAMRRAQALAEIADLQASFAQDLVKGRIEPHAVTAPASSIALDEVSIDRRGVRSSIYNTIEFATPIAELPLDLVTSFEAEAYERWRVNYERGWRWAFDPIGLRLSLKENQLAADLTILPLIAGTEYRDLIDLTQGATIPDGAGDRHGALVHAVLALRRESRWVGMLQGVAQESLKSDVKGWVGSTASVYVDDSPLWEELNKVIGERSPAELEAWGKENAHRFPLAFSIDVTDREKADAFLKNLRGFLEPISRPYFTWETRQHREQSYTRLAVTDQGAKLLVDRFALHIANLGDAIVISIAEETLKKAIDRRLDRPVRAAPVANDERPIDAVKNLAGLDSWTGRNLGLDIDGRAILVLGRFGAINQVPLMQQQSWENLFILNEWKRLFPDRDPVEVHEQLWGTRLVCSAGGKYVWNDSLQSMESSALGHAFHPKSPPSAAMKSWPFKQAGFRLTFENQGLRVEAKVNVADAPAPR